MNGLSVGKAFHTAITAFRNCLKRFPVAVAFIFVFTAYLIRLTATNWKGEDRLLFVIGYYLSVGIVLSLTLHLWSEEVKRRLWKIGVQLAAHTLLIADAFILYHQCSPGHSWIEIGIAHAAVILAVGLSVFFLSFLREKNDIASWNFALSTVSSYIVTQLIGFILCAGTCLLLFSLHQLFGIHISKECYIYIYFLCTIALALTLFLGLLPQGVKKYDREPHSSEFLNGILHYLFLPLTAGYLAVLYVYATRILIRWELPTGWVSWLVVTLMTMCIAIEFGLYPTRFKESKRFDNWVARWMPVLILPLLLLMTVGIVRRFNDYGITLNRLYLATLNGWFYIVCIGLFVTKARRINWIPISFAVIFLLTSVLPVNYVSISRNYLLKEVEATMTSTYKDTLPMNNEQYLDWLKTLPEKEALAVNSRLKKLEDFYCDQSIYRLVDKDVNYWTAKRYIIKEEAVVEDTVIVAGEDGDTIGLKKTYYRNLLTKRVNPLDISGTYTRVMLYDDTMYIFDLQAIKAGTIAFALPTDDVKETPDTAYVALQDLLEWDKQHNLTPQTLRCNRAGNKFVLTRFHLNTGDPAKKHSATLNFSGIHLKR
ncbi:DUF4153 domain-containing protein [uncultured Bacteroides sp.]|uniref:DUF4153 domain-containing protein n=1 Tax=uncultured Bacteroides sp. TaxID=162156 RepID=UPI002600CCD8|nr:DUF4153 domain-containing protein [uncultured Bacteroides sp.]